MSEYTSYPEVAPPHSDKQAYIEHDAYQFPTPSDAKPSRQFCGLPTKAFALVVALVLLLLGSAIGGGVGGSISTNNCKNKLNALQEKSQANCPPTRTVTATTSGTAATAGPNAPSTAPNTPTAATPAIPVTGCNETSFESTYVTTTGASFTKSCGYDYVGSDIVGAVVSSWDLCMESCGVYNQYQATPGTTCVGLAFVPGWIVEGSATSNISFWANCFLKYSVPTDLSSVVNSHPYEIVVSTLNQ